MDEISKQRLKHNEMVFRAVNDEIDEMGSGVATFICECVDVSCTETMRLPHDEYRRIRAQPGHFVLVPGHERPEIEAVVARNGDHVVVDKS